MGINGRRTQSSIVDNCILSNTCDSKSKRNVNYLATYIKSLARRESKSFIESVILSGFKVCFEGYGKLDETPVRLMGHVFYYDTSEGKYYEPNKDMYIENDEYDSLKQADDTAQANYVARINAGIQKTSNPKELHTLINAKNLYWDQDKAREAEAKAIQLSSDIPIMESDTIESDDIVSIDTNNMSSDDLGSVQTQLDDIKRHKKELETKQQELNTKTDQLINTSSNLSLNESKSKEASAVLHLMDTYEDPDYQRALKEVLKLNPNVDRKKLEYELNKYI